MILVIMMGLFGALVGAIIQWLNMRDYVIYLKEDEKYRRRKNLSSLRNKFKALSVEASNVSHNKYYSDAAREYHITAAEIWSRAGDLIQYKLTDLEEEEDDNIRNKN